MSTVTLTQPAVDSQELLGLWRKWTDYVERLVRRRGAAKNVSVEAYRELHTKLLIACGRFIPPAGSGLPPNLASIVEPWGTPAAIEQAGPHILDDLVARCRAVEMLLAGGRWRRNPLSRRERKLLWLSLSAAVAAAVLVWAVGGDLGGLVLEPLWRRVETMRIAMENLGFFHVFSVSALAVVTISIWLVSRSVRKNLL